MNFDNREVLKSILKQIKSSHHTLEEIARFYFETKKIILNGGKEEKNLDLISTNIFLECYSLVYKDFFNKEMKNFTDRELELLLILSEEASDNFDYLTKESSQEEYFSEIFTEENNKKRQQEIKILIKKASDEKERRMKLKSEKIKNSNPSNSNPSNSNPSNSNPSNSNPSNSNPSNSNPSNSNPSNSNPSNSNPSNSNPSNSIKFLTLCGGFIIIIIIIIINYSRKYDKHKKNNLNR
ncbi:MAG: Cell division protein CrgA [Mycoplasmataceae bacterium]|nr:MAG: Cell division protein CrgA [Mycoplasmataceae bacterium]